MNDEGKLPTALRCAARGWAVFPLAPGTKVPLEGSAGFKDATTDAGKIRESWSQNPEANIGIRTGSASGIIVVDVDAGDGKRGPATLAALEKRHGHFPQTRRIQTPHGGHHLYFLMPKGSTVKSGQNKLGQDIDVKADGGYIVAPPSQVDGAVYKVISSAPPAACLVARLVGCQSGGGSIGLSAPPRKKSA